MNTQEVFQTIDSLYEEYLKIFEDICNIESPTDCKEGVDAVGRYFTDLAKARGWKVDLCPQPVSGDAICITMNQDCNAAPISLSGHMDTVHPVGSFGYPVVTLDDEKIYGPGTQDCKGGLVAAFLAMDALERCGYRSRPVQLLLQSDEETGSKGSNKATIQWICQQAADSIAFFNLEGYVPGEIVFERKGIVRYKFTVSGKQAHSGKCDEGANAIAQAAHMILELEKFKDQKSLTCNCGTISGGTTPNTVPGSCMFVADFRYSTQEDKEAAEIAVSKVSQTAYIAGCSSTAELMSHRVSMPILKRNIALLEKVNDILAAEGMQTLTPKKKTGGSDASDVAAAGIPCLDNLGIQGGKSHSEHEFAVLASLKASAQRLAVIINHL